jgi:hypothetical protein
MSTCRSCGVPLLWVLTEKGKRMPLDIEPDDAKGTFVKLRVEENGDKVVQFVKESDRPGTARPLYTSHFVTCPNADEHRSPR